MGTRLARYSASFQWHSLSGHGYRVTHCMSNPLPISYASGMWTIILKSGHIHRRPMETLRSMNFYGVPVILEAVGDNTVLGCVIDVNTREVHTNLPREDWQFIHPGSAGTNEQKSASYRSRRHLILLQSFPECVKSHQLQVLHHIYTARKFQIGERKTMHEYILMTW